MEMFTKSINRVIDLASFLGSCDFDTIETVYERAMKTRCLRLATATGQTNPVFLFDQLPSGRYKSVKARVNIWSDCFRSLRVRKLNSWLTFLADGNNCFYNLSFSFLFSFSAQQSKILLSNNKPLTAMNCLPEFSRVSAYRHVSKISSLSQQGSIAVSELSSLSECAS